MRVMKGGLTLLLAACATPDKSTTGSRLPAVPSLEDMRAVSPALAHGTEFTLLGEVWKRLVCRRVTAAL